MREEHLRWLACPRCAGTLDLSVSRAEGGRVREGELRCEGCGGTYPVAGFIPRFVPPENYAHSFGLQWLAHPATQLDRSTGTDASRRRFLEQTGWPERMEGEAVLEAGSGAGRFTEHLAATGAMVVSMDYSRAVEANYASNGHRDNLLLVQGDIFAMPFPAGVFDRVFCGGVLQHTPDPRRAFLALLGPLRPGGRLAVDVYAKRWYTWLYTKYWVRPVTRRMDPERLHRLCRRWVERVWPVARRLGRLPLGRQINQALLVFDNGVLYPLNDEQRREWAVLDTFDALAPAYDIPQSLAGVRRWMQEAGLEEVEVENGWNGIEARAVKPAVASAVPPAPASRARVPAG
jgi:SAM-dependent methyltransferase